MAKGEITINEVLCKGCGLCIHHCNRDCISLSSDKLSPSGMPLVSFTDPEKCTACCVCAWLCPDFAIEVYKYTEGSAGA